MEKIDILTRGGIYLAKLDPSKKSEVGKIRPVTLLTSQIILDSRPPIIFICPLSSKSHKEYHHLHVELMPRDNLEVISYALVEHCRSIGIGRLIYPRLAQMTTQEVSLITHKLMRLIGY